MDLGLKGKVALVASSSQGMGRAIALGFAREGVKVSICARGEAGIQEAAESIRRETGTEVLAMAADMTRSEDIKNFVAKTAEKFGRIDIVLTNAGGPPPGEFIKFTDADWEKAFELSFLSTLRLTRETVPHLRKVGGGRIINLSSYAVKEPIAGLVLSNAIRNAVIGLAKTLSRELAKDNILINNVCPGRIDTARHRKLNEDRAKRSNRPLEEVNKEMKGEVPLGRYGNLRRRASTASRFLVALPTSLSVSSASIRVVASTNPNAKSWAFVIATAASSNPPLTPPVSVRPSAQYGVPPNVAMLPILSMGFPFLLIKCAPLGTGPPTSASTTR